MPALTSKDAAGIVGSKAIYSVNPTEIVILSGFNPRTDFDSAKMTELENSIQENGVLEPIRIYKNGDKLELINGERRVRACLALIARGVEILAIPAILETRRVSDAERLRNALITNTGVSLSPLEEARAYARLEAYGWTQQQIAKELGRSQGHVNTRLSLLNAVPAVQQAISSGEITTSEAVALIRETKNDSDVVQAAALETTIERKKNKIAARHTLSPVQKKENKFREIIFGLLDEHGVLAILNEIVEYADISEIVDWLESKNNSLTE